MFPEHESSYCWGYLEGSPVGYFLVAVDAGKVAVQFRIPGRGVVRQFQWSEPGKLRDTIEPPASPPLPITDEMLGRVKAASLCFCPSLSKPAKMTLMLNGQPAATETLDPTYCPFWHERQIAIPQGKLSLLRRINKVQIGNAEGAAFAIAHARIEIVLADGRKVSTPVSKQFLFSSPEAESLARRKFAGWESITPDRVCSAALGQPLGPVILTFSGPPGQ